MSKFTEGPWYWERYRPTQDSPYMAILRGKPNEHNDTMVTIMRDDLAQFTYAIDTPNAALIAAAPDLYAACKVALDVIEFWDGTIHEIAALDKLRAAITKAEGSQG